MSAGALGRVLDAAAIAIARLAGRLPRGGTRTCRVLRRLRPNLARFPLRTRYGTIVCDLAEPVCHPLLIWGEYPHWRLDEGGLSRIPLNNNSIVLDIGANIGVLTRMFAERAGHVHAFEPAPRALALLRANTEGLNNVTVHPLAVSDSIGLVHFVEREALDMSSMSHDEGIEVTATTIDALCLNPHFIKIDVEGFEDRVLKGALQTIRQSPIIMFEALSDTARERCELIIRGANPNYRFERLKGGTNYIAWPG